MRYGNRGRRSALRGDGGSLWISFSDLMSSLLLMFVLITFYSIYQNFNTLETKTAELEAQRQELAVKSAELEDRNASLQAAQIILAQKEDELKSSQTELEAAQGDLEAAQDELAAKQGELDTAQSQLTDAQAELLIQQAALQLAQQQLEESQAEVNAQKNAVEQSEQALAAAQQELERQRNVVESQQAVVEAQQAKLDEQQVQLDRLVGVRAQIIEQLIDELSNASITGAQVDDSGAIVFQSDMMFEKNRATLQPQGKRFLNSFIPRYIRVLMKGENAPYVSQIIVEGHADIDGPYLVNLELSQDRAYAVVEYVLSNEFTGITSQEKEWFQKIATVNGRSSVEPVYDGDGLIDKDASRRVVIKFRLNDENLVESMLDVLENMDEEYYGSEKWKGTLEGSSPSRPPRQRDQSLWNPIFRRGRRNRLYLRTV